MESILRLSNVSLMLDEGLAVRNMTWEVKRGENWAMIGPNGAGKTSLLSIINGYRWPTKGKISVLGREFGRTDLRELRSKIGMVSTYLSSWVSTSEKVLDVVASGKYGSVKLWEKGGRGDTERAEKLLKLVNCLRFKDRPLGELSEGERQKVMIARALMPEPKLLILDEPCEGLDLRARESFLESLSTIMMRGSVSVVDVTHRTDEIPRGITHAILLTDGRKVAAGPIEEVLTAKNLSSCFGVDVVMKKWRGRHYALVDERTNERLRPSLSQ